jgi:hypothetical protein
MEKQIGKEREPRQDAVRDLPQPEREAEKLTEREQEAARGGGGGVPGSPRNPRLD